MNKQHIVICTGGELSNWALPYIKEADLCIGADKGALFLIEHGIQPYLSIGDFDSVKPEQIEFIRSHSITMKDFDAIDKDYTDTELALHEALLLQPKRITIVGGLGTRFDHSIANIQLLTLAHNQHIYSEIVDAQNKLFLVSEQATVIKEHYPYLSILPFTNTVTGIDLIGMKYPLNDATIKKGQAIGISNVIVNEEAQIKVKSGTLLVIQSKD